MILLKVKRVGIRLMETMVNEYTGILTALSKGDRVLDTDTLLNSGYKMPVLGFGTYKIQGRDNITRTIDTALKSGYRSIDTATSYGNEEDIGAALKEILPKYNLKRENIFITSKLAPKDQGKDKVKQAVEESLRKLGTDYLDLYLIHWPGSALPDASRENPRLRMESWSGLEEMVTNGRLKSIGVSNYLPRHVKELIASGSVVPALNQVEFHPHWQQDEEFFSICAEHNILVQAYSSLGGYKTKDILNDPLITSTAAELGVTPAQVLLRWGLQRGAGIIPKSITPERIKLNSELDFVIPEKQMAAINNITLGMKYFRDPNIVI